MRTIWTATIRCAPPAARGAATRARGAPAPRACRRATRALPMRQVRGAPQLLLALLAALP